MRSTLTSGETSLSALTTGDVSAARTQIIAIAVGSCEQHGKHLPLDTDTRIAEALCATLASTHEGVLVGPTISITASGEHQGFAGTLSIGTVALTTVLVEIVRSADWARGVIFVNGHGGNAQAVNDAIKLLRREGRNASAWWPRIESGDAHAGFTETSLMLAIDPTAVRLEFAEVGETRPLAEIASELRRGGVAAVSDNGVLGDPRSATAQHGQELLTTLDEQLRDHFASETATWIQ